MKVKKAILGIVSMILYIVSSGQSKSSYTTISYTIDTQVNQQIKKAVSIENGVLNKSLKVKIFRNDYAIFNTYDKDEPLDCYTESFLYNDTIFITGHMKGEIGYGFQLAFFGDSCFVASFAYSDSAIYKYNNSDTASVNLILIPTATQKLTLSKRPLFKEGETIAGIVELKSKEFYDIYGKHEGINKMYLIAYFKTPPLKSYK